MGEEGDRQGGKGGESLVVVRLFLCFFGSVLLRCVVGYRLILLEWICFCILAFLESRRG